MVTKNNKLEQKGWGNMLPKEIYHYKADVYNPVAIKYVGNKHFLTVIRVWDRIDIEIFYKRKGGFGPERISLEKVRLKKEEVKEEKQIVLSLLKKYRTEDLFYS